MTDDLLHKKCVPCEHWVPPIKGEKLKGYLSQLQLSWEVVDEMKIRYMFKFKNFKEAMKFVNKTAEIAEQEGHHPDISISYNKVSITLFTHFIKGLTENDFILARKLEELQA